MSEEFDMGYSCDICGCTFDKYKNFWKHQNRKTSCVSKEKAKELVDKVQSRESRINYFKEKTKEQEKHLEETKKEVEFYKSLLSKNNSIVEHIDKNIKSVEEKLVLVEDKIDTRNNTVYTAKNQYFIDKLEKKENKSVINIQFAEPKKERMDHITIDMMMAILNHNDFDSTLKELIAVVFFHPEAPQNWNWCVTDKDAKFGALEYNHETNSIHRNSTAVVINKNLQNIMFRFVDMLDEVKTTRNFNRPQAINYNRLYNSLGRDFELQHITAVKEAAYAGRNLPRSLWDYLGIMVEKLPIEARIKLSELSELPFNVQYLNAQVSQEKPPQN